MLRISNWDSIAMAWSDRDLDLPADCRDPEAINLALGQAVAESPEGDGWEYRSHSQTGPILTIETRSDRNHLSIIIVNDEEQEA